MARFQKLHALAARWAGETNADRAFEAFSLIDEAARAQRSIGRYNSLYAATSTRMINRPLLLRPETLSASQESYFLPFIFNVSESEARKDYIDIHGSRRPASPDDKAAYERFSSAALEAASILEEVRNAPQQSCLAQMGRSLRMWVSVIASTQNFVAGQRIRDAHKDKLTAEPPSTFKLAGSTGDADYFAWYDLHRREFDNTTELIRLLKNGGFDYFAHAQRPEDEDTFIFGPNVIETLETKRKIMRGQWLDAQKYLAPPNR